MIHHRSTQCRIGVYGARFWYADRLGLLHEGKPPREVIVAVMADPTLTVDMRVMRRLGLPCDLRTEDDQVADLNRDLPAPPEAAPELAGDADDVRDLVIGVATSLALGAFLWAAVLLWVAG